MPEFYIYKDKAQDPDYIAECRKVALDNNPGQHITKVTATWSLSDVEDPDVVLVRIDMEDDV